VVLGIRGTDEIFNILSDTGLFVAALTNKPVVVPDTPQVEYIARYIHHFNLNASAEELQQLGQRLREFDQEVGTSMKNWYGLYATSALADASIVLKIIASGAIIGLSTSALMKLKEDTHRKLIERLESQKCRESIEKLGNTLNTFKQQHFPNFAFKIVGHSLGGVIAELCAVKIGVKCITFESLGALEILDQLAQYQNKPRNIINFLCAPNIINTLNHHPGKTYRIKLPHTDSSFSLLHGVNCILHTTSRALTFGSLGMFTLGKSLIIKGVARKAGLSAVGTKLAGGSGRISIVEIDSWPWVYWKNFANTLLEFARDFVPLQKDKPGIRNLIDEEGMREAQIKRIPGYREN
ncbi:2734_t:CDS:2, partial [Funneliformis mosseae]